MADCALHDALYSYRLYQRLFNHKHHTLAQYMPTRDTIYALIFQCTDFYDTHKSIATWCREFYTEFRVNRSTSNAITCRSLYTSWGTYELVNRLFTNFLFGQRNLKNTYTEFNKIQPKRSGCNISSVGIVTRYGVDRTGIESRWERDSPHYWSPPSLPYDKYRVSFPRVKRPGRDVNYSLHPPSA
jgi:hypothetical protein